MSYRQNILRKLLSTIFLVAALATMSFGISEANAQSNKASLCKEIAQKAPFIKCDEEITFVEFDGGLQAPDKKGYAPELTRATSAREFILNVTNFVLGFLGLAAVLAIVYGGVIYVTSAGDSEKAEKGKKSISYSVIGLLIVMSSFAIVNTVIQAPSGTESSGELASSAPEVNGETGDAAAQRRNFNIAATRVQTVSRDIITSYQNYLEISEALNDLKNMKETIKVESIADLSNYMNAQISLLENVESKAAPLGKLQEKASSSRQILKKYGELSIRELEKNIKPETKGSDWYGLLPIGDVILFNDKKAEQDSNIKDALKESNLKEGDLLEALKDDFEDTLMDYNADVAEVMEPIAGGSVKEFMQITTTTSSTSAEDQKIERVSRTKDDHPFYGTAVGGVFKTAFNNLRFAAETPNNQSISAGLEGLSNLYDSIKGLLFISTTINASTIQGSAPLVVQLDGLGSQDPNNETIEDSRFTWDFGDPYDETKDPDATGASTSHIYTKPGTYRVKLLVKTTDKEKVMDGIATKTIVVTPPTSYINLSYKTQNSKQYDIRKYDEAKGRTLVSDKSSVLITLDEAKQGIEFDASGSTDGSGKNKLSKFTWNFGDGTPPIEESTGKQTHTFDEEGNYRLVLEVEDAAGTRDRKIVTLVLTNTAARFKVLPRQTGKAGEAFTFDATDSSSTLGPITAYEWEVNYSGAGKPDLTKFPKSGEEIRYTFDTPGDYDVKLTITDSEGTEKNHTESLTILSEPPTSQFTHSIPRTNKPNEVHFDGSKSFDPDGARENLSYTWEINAPKGDYQFVNGTSATSVKPVVKFNKTGDYIVALTVKDEEGTESLTREQTVRIASTLAVEWDSKMKTASYLRDGKAEMTFMATAENAVAAEIRYGDGDKDALDIPGSPQRIGAKHSYEKEGNYEVKLIVFDKDDNENSISRRIYIGKAAKPISVINVDVNGERVYDLTRPIKVNRKDTITFDASESLNIDGTGRLLNYSWDFKDGGKSSKKTTRHTFKEISPKKLGYYPVELKVINKDNSAQTDVDMVGIDVRPVPPTLLGITATPRKAEPVTPLPVEVRAQGADDPDGKVTQYRWWYYDVKDPETPRGLQITSGPSTLITIGTNGEEGEEKEYKFAVELIDDENHKVASTDILFEEEVPSIKVTNGPNKAPVSKFTVDRTTILAGESINFSASARDADGKIQYYVWDFEGDGFYNNQPTKESTVRHIFNQVAKDGIKVKLKVIDDNFAEAVSTPVTIYVDSNAKPPKAAFTFETKDKNTVVFKNNSTADAENNATITKYIWDFDLSSNEKTADSDGDGSKDNDVDSTNKDPEFTYPAAGVYRVKLTVEDSAGGTDEVVNFVNAKTATFSSKDLKKPLTTKEYTGLTKAPSAGLKPAAPKQPVEKKDAPEARLLSTPTPNPKDNKIHLEGEEGNITFDFSGSVGEITNYYIDKNIYFDTNGNGINDDDKDYRSTRGGTWTTNFKKEWGRIRVKLTVEAADGQTDSVIKDVVFDDAKDATPRGADGLIGPGGKLSGNVLNTEELTEGRIFALSIVFAILSLSLLLNRKRRAHAQQ